MAILFHGILFGALPRLGFESVQSELCHQFFSWNYRKISKQYRLRFLPDGCFVYGMTQLISVKEKSFFLKSFYDSFSIMDFFSKYGQIRRKQRIWPHLLKKSFVKNFRFCAVTNALPYSGNYWNQALRKFTSLMPVGNERSHILKQTCDFWLQSCLSMYDPFVSIRHQRVKSH